MTADPRNLFVVVDVQHDFCTGGALAVDDTETLIPALNTTIDMVQRRGWVIVYTKDWHRAEHPSFKAYGGIWPAHCVQNTMGAELHKDLYVTADAIVIHKGIDDTDGYSPYENPVMVELAQRCGGTIYVAGIALEYCVKATCFDSVKNGVPTVAIPELIRAISSEQIASSLAEYQRVGVALCGGVSTL